MALPDDLLERAVLLMDDSIGVTTEEKSRKIQLNGSNTYYSTLPASWLDQLEIAEQGAKAKLSLSLGIRPVIVQNPAVILQPAALLPNANGSGERESESLW